MSLFNNNNNLQNQNIAFYPEVFFTNSNNQLPLQNQSSPKQQRSGLFNNLGISKEMISQFIPMLFGKGASGNNIFSLLQSGLNSGNNLNIFSSLFGEKKNISQIFSNLSQNNSTSTNKKDMSNIIDMSDYKEIKN